MTGGAGFLGRALWRRAAAEGWDIEGYALSRDDAKHARLQARYPWVRCILGDVAAMPHDELRALFTGFDVVIHAAASKYVDRAETAAADTIRTNIDGSRNVLDAALAARVPDIVAISTDKACAPTSTYGITKAAMERLWQGAPSLSTRVRVVRYGNVVGSTGSVLPLFMEMARKHGPIPLTDPLMTRFWMSADQAIDTVLYALDAAPHGHLVVPRMAALDMKNLVRMVLGYDEMGELPDQALPLSERRVFIRGVRPGEKRHESLVHEYESLRTITWPERNPLWGDADYVVIAPPGSPATHEPYSIVSSEPPGGWIGLRELRAIVEDAEAI